MRALTTPQPFLTLTLESHLNSEFLKVPQTWASTIIVQLFHDTVNQEVHKYLEVHGNFFFLVLIFSKMLEKLSAYHRVVLTHFHMTNLES